MRVDESRTFLKVRDECEYTPPYRNGGCAAFCGKELLRGDVTGWVSPVRNTKYTTLLRKISNGVSYTSGGYLGTTLAKGGVGCSIRHRPLSFTQNT